MGISFYFHQSLKSFWNCFAFCFVHSFSVSLCRLIYAFIVIQSDVATVKDANRSQFIFSIRRIAYGKRRILVFGPIKLFTIFKWTNRLLLNRFRMRYVDDVAPFRHEILTQFDRQIDNFGLVAVAFYPFPRPSTMDKPPFSVEKPKAECIIFHQHVVFRSFKMQKKANSTNW